jgi:hypothetical protein
MPFQLIEPTRATIASVTLRREMHGEDLVPAVSIGLAIPGGPQMLDILGKGLRGAFFDGKGAETPKGQTVEMQLADNSRLRFGNLVETIALKGELVGWKLSIDYGVAGDIVLGNCKVDKFRIELHEGAIELRARVGTCDVDDTRMGHLAMLIDREVSITLTSPKVKDGQGEIKESETSAKSDAKPKKGEKQPDATEAFLASQGAGE